MKQRSMFSITTLMLMALRERSLPKTRLMQDLTLNYRRVNWYCGLLEQQGLIKRDAADRHYSMTPRGREVLQLSEELAGFIMPVDQLIKKYCFCIQDHHDDTALPQINSLDKPFGQ